MSLGTPRRVSVNWNKRTVRPWLHPPCATPCVNNNPLSGVCTGDSSRDEINSFSATLRRGRDLAELDRRSSVGMSGLASVQRNTEKQHKRFVREDRDSQRLHKVCSTHAERRHCSGN